MKNSHHKITRLKKEIEVKDFIVKELIMVITQNKITMPKKLLEAITFLYKGEKK